MKYVKVLAIAAVAAGALMAFIGAGTASASVICSTTADPCPAGQAWPNGTKIKFSLKSGTSASLLDTKGNSLDTCTSASVEGEITNTGSSTETVTGKITGLIWGIAGTPCTFTTTTLKTACLEVHQISGTSNGTVTADKCTGGNANSEVTINTGAFGSCVYTVAAGKSIGDITEGIGTGAVFTANAVAEKTSGILCPETAKWEATYVLTTPSNTTLSVSSAGS